MKAEIIDALMPGFLAALGVIFGGCALLAPGISDDVRSAGLGVAGAAITGAAALAQPERRGRDR